MESFKKRLIAAAVGILMVLLFVFNALNASGDTPPPLFKETKEETAQETHILVEIKGAIRKPGVYMLESSSRLYELLDAAGGVTEEGTTLSLNLARKLIDGESVLIPSTVEDPPHEQEEDSATYGRVNINTAGESELTILPKIGPATAQNIIAYREANGPFMEKTDIMEVSGIGEATYESIESLITVQG